MNKDYPIRRAGFTLVEIMVVVVVIGLLASIAIPAFKKIRQSSQDKLVFNNARQLSAGSDQYFMESGFSSVDLAMLVGPTNYIKSLNTVAGEVYPLTYQHGVAITITGVASLRTITFTP